MSRARAFRPIDLISRPRTETFPSVGGQIIPPPGYLPKVYDHIRAAGGICIADEVQTGLGRLGDYYFGFEHQGAVPDIVVLGKPIGNGHSLGVVITTPDIAGSFAQGPEFFSTFGGSTLSRRIGSEVLQIVDDEDLMGSMMYPKVYAEYMARHAEFGPVRTLPTKTFFYGMEPGDEISAEIDPGKTLEIRLQAVGEPHQDGSVRVFFELNGQPRVVRVADKKASAETIQRPKAEVGNPNHLGAPMPGVVATVAVQEGAEVKEGDLLVTIEAMKMETGLHAERDAVVKAVHVSPGSQIDAKDLLVEFD